MKLLEQVESYLSRTKVPPSTFGRQAVGDPRLVGDLRSGRRLRSGTQERLEKFLALGNNEIELAGQKMGAPRAL